MRPMKKRGKIRIFAFTVSLIFVLCGFLSLAKKEVVSRRTQLEYTYRRSLNDLVDYVSSMEDTLEKAPFIGGGMTQTTLSAKLLEQSEGAKAALSALPASQETGEVLSRFLSQTGDYALQLARLSAAGLALPETVREDLANLHAYAGKLSGALQKAQTQLTSEAIIDRLSFSQVEAMPLLDDSFDEAAEAFSEFPALLYDGPFSDHILRRTPLALAEEPECTEAAAREIAAAFLEVPSESLSCAGVVGTTLASYSFSNEDSHINITKIGGKIAYFKKAGMIETGVLRYEDALEKAKEFLAGLGIPAMKESYYLISDHLCTINFSYEQELEDGSVTCYPDLIKVTIELSQGGAVEYDASGYLMNHRARELPAPTLSQEEAAEHLSPLLTVQEAALALIPTPGLHEVLCWEFLCTAGETEDQKELLVYVNTETGQEEQLYLLQKDEHGVLAL